MTSEVFEEVDSSELAGVGTNELMEEVLTEKEARIRTLDAIVNNLQERLAFEIRYNTELEKSLDSLESKQHKPVETISRIRVMLSRPITWAEVEELTTDHTDPHQRRLRDRFLDDPEDRGFKLWVAPNRQHVWVEGYAGSRILYDLVAKVLDEHFVNVYPKAVRTFTEYNGE